MSEVLYISNDNRIKYVGLIDADGTYQNAATITVTINDKAGSPLTGQGWPLVLGYVAGSNGDYEGVASHAISGLTDGDPLFAVVDIASGGLTASYEVPVIAETRKR